MKKEEQKKINCDVEDCLYNEIEEGKCLLKDLYISSLNRGNTPTTTSSTICQSFQTTGGIITDTEYEISAELTKEEEEIA